MYDNSDQEDTLQDPRMEAQILAETAAGIALTRNGKQINLLFARAKGLVGEKDAQRIFVDAFVDYALAVNGLRFAHRVPSPVDRIYKVVRRHAPAALVNPAFETARLRVRRMHPVTVGRPKWHPRRGLAATGLSSPAG